MRDLRSRLLTGLAFAVALGVAPARAQDSRATAAPPESRSASRPADFTSAGMTARLRELLPHVERVLGEPMPGPPVEVVASEIREIEALELETDVIVSSEVEGGLRGEDLRESKRFESRLRSQRVGGLVELPTGRIHLVPANLPNGSSQESLDLILIHECVHVFQTRRLGLPRMLAHIGTLDEFTGIQAVTEGHADWVTHQVAQSLGTGDAFTAYRRELLDPRGTESPQEARAYRARAEVLCFAYVEGEKFIDAVVRELGYRRAVAKVFQDPPASQHAVKNPADYLHPKAGVVEPAEMGRRLAALFPGKERVQSIAAEDGIIRAEFSAIDEKMADAAMAGYVGGAIAFQNPKDGREGHVAYASIVTFSSPEGAARWFDAQVDVLRKKEDTHRDKIESADYGERETIDGITMLLVTQTLDMEEDEPLRVSILVSRKGPIGSQIGAMGAATTKGEMVALARRVIAEVPIAIPFDPASRSAASSRSAEPSRPLEDAPEPGESLPAVARISGTLTWDDDAAGPASFTIRFWSLSSPDRPFSIATGKDGKFEVELPTGGTTRIGMIVAEGDYDDTHVGTRVRVTPGRVLTLAIKRPEFIDVLVVDGATSRPVKDARVHMTSFPRGGKRDDDEVLPSGFDLRSPPRVTDESGRIRFRIERRPDFEVPRRVFVVAPHHRWREADLPEPGRTVEVRLEPGGALRIHVQNWSSLAEPAVSIQRATITRRQHDFTYPVETPKPDDRGEVLVEGLTPGIYGVLVGRGEYFRDGPTYGTALAEVKAGATSEVSVEVAAAGPTGTIEGMLEIPQAYGKVDDAIHLKLVGTDATTIGSTLETVCRFDSAARRGSFRFEKVTFGNWAFVLEDLQWRVDVRAVPDGTPLALTIPEPGRAEIRVLDGRTGEPVRRPVGRWRTMKKLEQWSSVAAEWDAREQVLRLLAAPGPGELDVDRKGYKEGVVNLTLEAGAIVKTSIELAPAGSILVRVRADGRDHDFPRATIRWKEGPRERTRSLEDLHGAAELDDLDAGEYEVEIDDVPGFKPVPKRSVKVEIGKPVEVVIDLEKAE